MPYSVDFLTVHFGRGQWTSLLVQSIRRLEANAEIEIRRLHVVDNSRDGWINGNLIPGPDLVFHSFPVDQDQLAVYHHDHPAGLTRGLEQSDADILVIMDCDAHILRPDFLHYVAEKMLIEKYDAIAAPDLRFGDIGLSHPCFLVLSRDARRIPLPFDSSKVRSEYDVGRLIRKFLTARGLSVYVPRTERAFDGVWGDVFDGQVYHHGGGTFVDSTDAVIQEFVHEYDKLFADCVLRHHRFKLSVYEKWKLRLHSRLVKLRKWLGNA